MIIDIDHEQKDIDLHLAKTQGVTHVIAKASQGASEQDPEFTNYRARCIEVGLGISAYHFLTADQVADQWTNFCNAVGDRTGLGVIALDVEDNKTWSPWDTMDAGHHLAWVKADKFACQMVMTGHSCLVYADGDYYDNVLIKSAGVGNWVADTNATEPVIPGRFGAWDLWQYSWNQNIGGIDGIDCSRVNPNSRFAKVFGE